jgi:hypothetical protein
MQKHPLGNDAAIESGMRTMITLTFLISWKPVRVIQVAWRELVRTVREIRLRHLREKVVRRTRLRIERHNRIRSTLLSVTSSFVRS